MPEERQNLEGQQRRGGRNDQPRTPPSAMDERPALDEARQAIGHESHEDNEKAAPTGRARDELTERDAPSSRVMLEVGCKPQHPTFEPEVDEHRERDRKGEPQEALDELVGDDDDEPART